MYVFWAQFLCLVAIELTIADMLQTIPAVSIRCCKLLPRASHVAMNCNSLQLNSSVIRVTKLSLQIIQFTINSNMKIPLPLPDNSEVFILTLRLSGGQMGQAWEPYSKMMGPPSPECSVSHLSSDFRFCLFYSSFCLPPARDSRAWPQ